MALDAMRSHRQSPELEGIHTDHPVQLLAPQRTTPKLKHLSGLRIYEAILGNSFFTYNSLLPTEKCSVTPILYYFCPVLSRLLGVADTWTQGFETI